MAQRNRVEALDRIHVPSVDGRAVPLRALADPGMETGPARIERHDRERSVTLTAYVGPGHLTGAVTQAALDRVRGAVRLPAGSTHALGGEAEEQESGKDGTTAGPQKGGSGQTVAGRLEPRGRRTIKKKWHAHTNA